MLGFKVSANAFLDLGEPFRIRRVLRQLASVVWRPVIPPDRPPFAQRNLGFVDTSARGADCMLIAGALSPTNIAARSHEILRELLAFDRRQCWVRFPPQPPVDDDVSAIGCYKRTGIFVDRHLSTDPQDAFV